jgi:hypothetical protein
MLNKDGDHYSRGSKAESGVKNSPCAIQAERKGNNKPEERGVA